MKQIQLTVTVEQANLILEGLGELPFARVYELIASLQKQAKGQIGASAAPTATTPAVPKLVTGDAHGE